MKTDLSKLYDDYEKRLDAHMKRQRQITAVSEFVIGLGIGVVILYCIARHVGL